MTSPINTEYIGADTVIDFLYRVKENYWKKTIVSVLDYDSYPHFEGLKLLAEKLE